MQLFGFILQKVQFMMWLPPQFLLVPSTHFLGFLAFTNECCLSFLWWRRGSEINDRSLKAFSQHVWTLQRREALFLSITFRQLIFTKKPSYKWVPYKDVYTQCRYLINFACFHKRSNTNYSIQIKCNSTEIQVNV